MSTTSQPNEFSNLTLKVLAAAIVILTKSICILQMPCNHSYSLTIFARGWFHSHFTNEASSNEASRFELFGVLSWPPSLVSLCISLHSKWQKKKEVMTSVFMNLCSNK
jgi:hypothetical protein